MTGFRPASENGAAVLHPIPPVWNADSRILILGSFPSAASREAGFFYGHPRNRFWQVLAAVTGDRLPDTVEERRAFLLRNRIAVWDVIASCTVTGSSDASIRNVVPTDLSPIFAGAAIRTVYCNGSTAFRLYCARQEPLTGRAAVCLPSTSPANAGWRIERLTAAWNRIGGDLND